MTPMKVKGGTTKQKINRQDTKHGIIDLPVARLRKQGFAEGGMMKRKFRDGGGVQADVRKADRFRPSQLPASERQRLVLDAEAELHRANNAERRVRPTYKSFDDYERRSPVFNASRRVNALDADESYQYRKGGSVKPEKKGFKPFAKKEGGNPFGGKAPAFGGKPKFAAGGKVGRGDGCCVKGKTKGRMC